MVELFELARGWFFGLGDKYGVNPVIFGSIYVGAIPFFMISITWLVRNYRQNKSIVFPEFCATGCFVLAYVYLIIVGKNVPWCVYGIVVLTVLYGAWSTYRTVRKKLNNLQ